MKLANHKQRGGFSLVELLIAFSVLGLILGSIGMVGIAGRDAYQEGLRSSTLEGRARRALERIASELTPCIESTLTPNPGTPLGLGTVQFQTCLGYAAGAQLQSSITCIRLESDPADPDDGIDNDSDGMVDERQIVLIRNFGSADQIQTVICTNVAEMLEGETANMLDDNGNGLIDEGGLSIAADGQGTLRIRLTVLGRDAKNNQVRRTLETSVHMRN
ncbi:MAG: prepilin-type N-terminal cleavage/methylation domain-containing protein [Planctomycetes bacterium]|nr:prepilin-type N-terminal cleavage/methylation domain-containing protein [Planctomycetota bacterium]